MQPPFRPDCPSAGWPLGRKKGDDPAFCDRFELFVCGKEIANGFSELNDPEDQAARFMQQAKAKDAGDEEAMYYDADYIRALEYGLPPTGGCVPGIWKSRSAAPGSNMTPSAATPLPMTGLSNTSIACSTRGMRNNFCSLTTAAGTILPNRAGGRSLPTRI